MTVASGYRIAAVGYLTAVCSGFMQQCFVVAQSKTFSRVLAQNRTPFVAPSTVNQRFGAPISGTSPGSRLQRLTDVATMPGCMQLCTTTSGCLAMVYTQSSGTCDLLDRTYDALYQSTSDGAVTANRLFPGVPCSVRVWVHPPKGAEESWRVVLDMKVRAVWISAVTTHHRSTGNNGVYAQ